MEPHPRPRVLLAATHESAPALRHALRGIAKPIVAYSEDEALRLMGPDVRFVVCTMRFDDSRMLHFLSLAARKFPHVRFICFRGTEGHLPESSLRAVGVAAAQLGAVAFVDLPGMRARHGKKRALELLGEILRDQISSFAPFDAMTFE
jgi:hypothetical protein